MTYKLTNTSQPADPYYGAVSLLLHGDGADGSTQIIDSSPRTKIVTAVGDAQISTAQSKFGGSSIAFDGSGDYLVSASNIDFAFGTGDFTIELWLYISTTGPGQIIVDGRTSQLQITPTIFVEFDSLGYYVNGSIRISDSFTLVNTWVHLALARSQASTRLFVNGTQFGSTYADSNNYIQSPVYIGARWDATAPTFGYIDDLRITKGIARYTSNFTPPTQPFIGKPIVGNDLYHYATSLLLKGDGTNGSTTIVDNSFDPKTITVNGDAQISTAQSKFGGSSLKFDGSGDYIDADASSPDFELGSDDFTIETWVLFNSDSPNDGCIISKHAPFTPRWVEIRLGSTQGAIMVQVSFDGTSWGMSYQSNNLVTTNIWYHIALVRSGSAFTTYINGVASGTASSASSISNNTSYPLRLGARGNADQPLDGYIDDLRITKGVARYTSNFTPPGSLPTF